MKALRPPSTDQCSSQYCRSAAILGSFWCRAHMTRERLAGKALNAQSYELACMLCGRGRTVGLTNDEAKALRPSTCDNCGGRVLLTIDDPVGVTRSLTTELSRRMTLRARMGAA